MRWLTSDRRELAVCLLSGSLLILLALWTRGLEIRGDWQRTGQVVFALGFVMLAAYLSGQVCRLVRLPLISGYIFAGILAGPFASGFLDPAMVVRLRLVDDLALSFIALTAGGALDVARLRPRRRAIAWNITLLTVVVLGMVGGFVMAAASRFALTAEMDGAAQLALAMLLGCISVARSPSSAIAIIDECRAAGPFTETVLGVTVAMDVLIIVLFTVTLSAVAALLHGTAFDPWVALSMLSAVAVSLGGGLVLGAGIVVYIRRVGHDLPLFLVFMAFAVAKASAALNLWMQASMQIHLSLEPLLICMSAGFCVRALDPEAGRRFMEGLHRLALPIFLLFFTMAGASLNLEALARCWPLALAVAGVRAGGIFVATWSAACLAGDPPRNGRIAWMAYLTQAGVSIGLAQLAARQLPQLSVYLTTIVLAVITVNQVLGPIGFKLALGLAGESGRR